MRMSGAGYGLKRLIPLGLLLCSFSGHGQTQPPANSHVIIPNPTPRDPDLEQVYGNDADGQRKAQIRSIKSQLRGREIWLEANQILLLAQQLRQDMSPGKKPVPLSMSAAKVA